MNLARVVLRSLWSTNRKLTPSPQARSRACLVVLGMAIASHVSAFGQQIERVNLDGALQQTSGASAEQLECVLSGNGAFVAFASYANSLDVDAQFPANNESDIFRRNLVTHQVDQISIVQATGLPFGTQCKSPSISRDGSRVVFAARIAGATQVWLRLPDAITPATYRVTTRTGGGEAISDSSAPMISANGNFIVFASDENMLLGAISDVDPAAASDIFVADVTNPSAITLSWISNYPQPGSNQCMDGHSDTLDGPCSQIVDPTISEDGRYIAFRTLGGELLAVDNAAPSSNSFSYVYDRNTGMTKSLNLDRMGLPFPSSQDIYQLQISGNGDYVAFSTTNPNIVASDTNLNCAAANFNGADCFIRNISSIWGGSPVYWTWRVSNTYSGAELCASMGIAPSIVINRDATVALLAIADNGFVAGDADGATDVFRKQIAYTGANAVVGPPESISFNPSLPTATNGGEQAIAPPREAISDDGLSVAFVSAGTSLVAGDTNGLVDAFLWHTATSATICAGDTSLIPCPCGNNAPANSNLGCLNSLGLGGSLSATGASSLSADSVVLAGSQMPNSSALYFQGIGVSASQFGDGIRCATGAVIRLAVTSNVIGASQYPGPGDPSVSVRGLVAAPGFRAYQVWYRNSASFCTSATFNLTNGFRISWGP